MVLKREQPASVYALNWNLENGLPGGALSMPVGLYDTRGRPLSVEGMLVIVSNLSKNTCINSSSKTRFGNEIHLSLGRGEKKKILKKKEKRESEKKFIAWIFQELLFSLLFSPLSL